MLLKFAKADLSNIELMIQEEVLIQKQYHRIMLRTTFPGFRVVDRKKNFINDTPKNNLNILFVEDVPIHQKIIRFMLSSLGHKVTIASNGKLALDLFQPGKFDLIFMDIRMPVMDGLTATQKLKEKHDDLPPIVGLSANAFEGDREKFMAMGMDEYLTKPVIKDDLKKMIIKTLTCSEIGLK